MGKMADYRESNLGGKITDVKHTNIVQFCMIMETKTDMQKKNNNSFI